MRPRNLVRGAFLVLAVGLLIAALVNEGPEIADSFGRLAPVRIVAAAAAVAVGLGAQMLSWRALFDGSQAADLPLRATSRVYFVGQLGKYIPGSVWAVVAQADLARRHHVTRVQSAAVALGALVVLTITGGAFGAMCLAFGSQDAVATYWWAVAAVPFGFVLVWPPVFNRIVALGLRARRTATSPPPALTGRGVARSLGWALVMWFAFGGHAWVIAVDLGATGLADAAVVGGAFALAWVVGFLVILAPAGAGPREAAFVLALSPVMGSAQALVLALVSRVLMMVGDAVAAAAFVRHGSIGGGREDGSPASAED